MRGRIFLFDFLGRAAKLIWFGFSDRLSRFDRISWAAPLFAPLTSLP